jgi:hypothetical protein
VKTDPLGQLIGLFVGPPIRAILAAILVAACSVWAYQNALFPGSEIQSQAQSALEANDLSKVDVDLKQAKAWDPDRDTAALMVDGIAPPMTAWANSFNVGIAGLFLFGSLLFRGNVMSLTVLLGTGVIVVGHHLGIKTVEPFREHQVALMLGAMIVLVGYRIGRR